MALGHLRCRSNLGALRTSEVIVRYPPAQLQSRWAEKAEPISRDNRVDKFEKFAD